MEFIKFKADDNTLYFLRFDKAISIIIGENDCYVKTEDDTTLLKFKSDGVAEQLEPKFKL